MNSERLFLMIVHAFRLSFAVFAFITLILLVGCRHKAATPYPGEYVIFEYSSIYVVEAKLYDASNKPVLIFKFYRGQLPFWRQKFWGCSHPKEFLVFPCANNLTHFRVHGVAATDDMPSYVEFDLDCKGVYTNRQYLTREHPVVSFEIDGKKVEYNLGFP
jgi:hypothetical protein